MFIKAIIKLVRILWPARIRRSRRKSVRRNSLVALFDLRDEPRSQASVSRPVASLSDRAVSKSKESRLKWTFRPWVRLRPRLSSYADSIDSVVAIDEVINKRVRVPWPAKFWKSSNKPVRPNSLVALFDTRDEAEFSYRQPRWKIRGMALVNPSVLAVLSLAALISVTVLAAFWQHDDDPDTAFVYTSKLLNVDESVDDQCDFRFSLFNSKFGGRQIGETLSDTIPLQSGKFTSILDYGYGLEQIEGQYMDIGVRCPAGDGEFAHLIRQTLNSARPFDMKGYSALARDTFGHEDDDRSLLEVESGQSSEQVKSSDDSSDEVVRTDAVDSSLDDGVSAATRQEVKKMGAKGRDVEPGHNGAKRAAAMAVPEPGEVPPEVKRAEGRKGNAGIGNNKRNRLNDI